MKPPLRIGLAIPLQGPAGIFGPSCEKVATMAAAHLNDRHGILGREVVIEVIDAGGTPEQVRAATQAAIRGGRIHAVTGWHISSVREHLAPLLAEAGVPYVYTSLHEGTRTPGVLNAGETPASQVAPGMRWLRTHFGVRRWAIVGADYIWPRSTARAVRAYAEATGLDIVQETFVRYGGRDFRGVLADLASSAAQGVVMLLVGRDAVHFNRQFAAAGLQDRLLRFTPLMEENMLLASGGDATRELYDAAAYFNTLATPSALEFSGSYGARYGPGAPMLNNAGESCYEGILALVAVAERTGVLDARRMLALAEDGVEYEGPRGRVQLVGGTARQQVHLARASALQFDVLASLPSAG